jgi:hypothetical protein
VSLMLDDDVSQCRQQVIGYHLAIDRGRATTGIDAFTDDAEFELRGERLHGRAAILEFLTRREAMTERLTAHQISNEHVVAQSADELVLGCLVQLYLRGADGTYDLEKILDTTHTLRRTAEGWRIAQRTSRPLHGSTGGTA